MTENASFWFKTRLSLAFSAVGAAVADQFAAAACTVRLIMRCIAFRLGNFKAQCIVKMKTDGPALKSHSGFPGHFALQALSL